MQLDFAARAALTAALFWTATANASAMRTTPPNPQEVRIVLRHQDILSNGASFRSVDDVAVGDEGTWAAIVVAFAGGAYRSMYVVNGQVLMVEGTMLQDGTTPIQFHSVAVSREGVPALHYAIEDPTTAGATVDRIRIGTDVVFSVGQSVALTPPLLDGTVQAIAGFDFEGDRAVIACSVRLQQSGVIERARLLGRLSAGNFVPESGIVTGATYPSTSATFFSSSGHLSLVPGGTIAASVLLLDGGFRFAVEVAGSLVAVDGDPGPLPGSTWQILDAPRVSLAEGAHHAFLTRFHDGSITRDIIVVDGANRIVSGLPLPGTGGGVAASLGSSSFHVTDAGEFIATLHSSHGPGRLFANEEVVLEDGKTIVDGLILGGLLDTFPQAFAASSDGKLIYLAAKVQYVLKALLVVEREIADSTTCVAEPNSTGTAGTLSATGSRYIDVHALQLMADGLPQGVPSMLLTSKTPGFSSMPGGSVGNLCLAGQTGRFTHEIQVSDSLGHVEVGVDPGALPSSTGTQSAMHGETWYFQFWHRDVQAGAATSNFTDSRSIRFL